MRWIRKVGSDLSEGRNLEVYLTLVISLVLIVLSTFNIVSLDAVATGILATLLLLALGTINSRDQVASLQQQTKELSATIEKSILGKTRAQDFFLAERPKYDNEFMRAKHIYITGATLSRTVRDYFGVFEQRLREGALVRFVIIDPKSEAVRQAALRSYGVTSAEFYPNRIKPTVDSLQILASFPELKGKLEFSLLPFMPSFGLALIDPDEVDGKIYVEIYQHKSVAPNPTFVLDRRHDPRWYDFFHEQFNLLWASARPANADDGYSVAKQDYSSTDTQAQVSQQPS